MTESVKKGSVWYHERLSLHLRAMSEPLMYNENGSGQERVSRCCLENCPTHLEHLSQWRYREVAAFRHLFTSMTHYEAVFLTTGVAASSGSVSRAILPHNPLETVKK